MNCSQDDAHSPTPPRQVATVAVDTLPLASEATPSATSVGGSSATSVGGSSATSTATATATVSPLRQVATVSDEDHSRCSPQNCSLCRSYS